MKTCRRSVWGTICIAGVFLLSGISHAQTPATEQQRHQAEIASEEGERTEALIRFNINSSDQLQALNELMPFLDAASLGEYKASLTHEQLSLLIDSMGVRDYDVLNRTTGQPNEITEVQSEGGLSRTTDSFEVAATIQGDNSSDHGGDWTEGSYPTSEIPFYSWGALGMDIWNTTGWAYWRCISIPDNVTEVRVYFRSIGTESDTDDHVKLYFRYWANNNAWDLWFNLTDRTNALYYTRLTGSDLDRYVNSSGWIEFIAESNDGWAFDYIEFQYELPPTEISLDRTSFPFSENSGIWSTSLTVSGGNPDASWAFNSVETSWYTVNPTQGTGSSSIFVRAQANTGGSRSDYFQLYCGEADNSPITCYISQEAAPTTLSVSPTGHSFPDEGGQSSFSVSIGGGDPDAYWSISGLSSWLSASPDDGYGSSSVTLTASQNNAGSRSDGFSVNCSGASPSSASLSATQEAAPPTLSVNPTELTFSGTAESKPIYVTIGGGNPNASWSVSESLGWLAANPSSGSGSATVAISVPENTSGSSKSGVFRVQCANGSPSYMDVSVTQEYVSSVDDAESSLPERYTLASTYPNPFNPSLTVVVELPEPAALHLVVYNALGEIVDVLHRGYAAAGARTFVFDGSAMASGTYYVQAMVPGKLDQIEKVVLMK